ncbi:hypothetical protein C0Q70_20850 [Pomacea canaliculata]|uniref:Uncharacterized protein n=2 Tax=Pomacea canaliculata TaxID=400727 RepID=A0A2T7NAW3_POMCA|nr:hypothetical protein C0Q70_20850 [Pomacea canaliculata]
MLLLVLPRPISSVRRNFWGRRNNFFEDTFKLNGLRSGEENSRKKTLFDDVFARSSPPRLLPTNDVATCTPASCGGKRDKQLWEEVNMHYQNLFYSPDDVTSMNSVEVEPTTRSNELPAIVQPKGIDEIVVKPDFDQCCRTNRAFQIKTGIMKDINNVECSIISFGNKFQVAYVGTCSSSTAQGCPGTCRPEISPVHFLCVNTVGQLEFRFFNVETYCSCKAN